MAGLAQSLRSTLDAVFVALFPPRCGACNAGLAVRPPFGLCDACFEVLEPNSGARCERCDLPDVAGSCPDCRARAPAFSALRAPWVYGGPVTDLVVAAKFRGREDLAAAVGRLLAEDEVARTLAGGVTCCVPVPLGASRRRKRGYNQSAVIARMIGRAWDVPVRYLLKRRQETAPQSDLPLAQRRANVAGAFCAAKASGTVLLVDDVVTSGETVREAAAGLLDAGASEVRVVALARAPLRD